MKGSSLQEVIQHPDYQVIKRVPMQIRPRNVDTENRFIATIIDLETMGLNPVADEIIEIGMLAFEFTSEDGIVSLFKTYNELNDPGRPIPVEVSKITGIYDKDVAGKKIEWEVVTDILQKSHLLLCHNAGFDRRFLEQQTPRDIAKVVQSLPFACTVKDISWKERGFESAKLDYLNWKLGYFYDGHRALNDCWATLNLLTQAEGAFDELKQSVKVKETLICALAAPFEKKELLKSRGYRWSDGSANLPKCWWNTLNNNLLAEEQSWLDDVVYGVSGHSETLPKKVITAHTRYSHRAEIIN
jgi:DNA polymerase III subunit epsilon